LGWSWVDADDRLQQRVGKTIAEIFADDGERKFRNLESQLVDELLTRTQIVIAWGGGVILREQNRQRLRESSYRIWLKASADTIAARLEQDLQTDSQRPRLTSLDEPAEICSLLEERQPLYEESADLAVDTDGLSPDEVADEIWRKINGANGLKGIGRVE
jgi:shikimate kinase